MTAHGTHSLKFLEEKYKGEHNIETNTLYLRLLDDTYPGMDVSAHGQWSDIAEYELADGNGYVAGTGIELTGVTVEAITAGDAVLRVTATNKSFEASGGDIPASKAAAIINATHTDNTIVAVIEYGQTYITEDGKFLYFNFEDGLFEAEPQITT